MDIFRILFIVALIGLLVYVINYLFFQQNKALSKCTPATKKQEIKAKKLKGSHNDNNYAYSIWFYVTDWQYRLSESKDLLAPKSVPHYANIMLGSMFSRMADVINQWLGIYMYRTSVIRHATLEITVSFNKNASE